ncbi:MAG: hypothetical protein UU81_C0034G0007 [Microgenomates group bacterium GW2011_GWC1_41_8]|uniref:ATPase n=1 Tax=Candidatus Roizmanbacteria bacterium GW2011_GWA1_41_13 TaxID=1618474 RepID=A0A0G0XUW3_9BACT|nr:MAG: ATPase [Candidatus Roizmanbacteria bacterium GW2011_GWA1_41_13]KKS23274.1 MAG: hypothetical protein UU81_C0034G0007 [Microgenomates group bacterium GW2011_GWC1_41_8]
MITRTLADTIQKDQKPGFVTIIYGPRRVGKTVLLDQLMTGIKKEDVMWFNGDIQESRDVLSTNSDTVLRQLVQQAKNIVIDEAQRIPNIGLSIKILIDAFPEKRIYVTGSSSLMLSRGLQDSLTGRNKTYRLFPLSTHELTEELSMYQKRARLDEQLRFGGYPYLQSLATDHEKTLYLRSIVSDYVFKDVLELTTIEQPDNLRKLAILLAFQIGSQVSYNELAQNLRIDVKTIMRYLSLLRESFVVFEVGSFSRNLRNELSKSKKYYFWDLGIRNALIDQFMSLEVRPDKGQLWENFLAVERVKLHEYQANLKQYFFWRTYEQVEIDWLELQEGTIHAYEFKWRGVAKTPKAFRDAYQTSVETISPDNYLEFITR